jgi:hypothetical protein
MKGMGRRGSSKPMSLHRLRAFSDGADPAMEAGEADHVWRIEEIAALAQ